MSCSCKIGGGPDGVCYECRSRELFHSRLKKLEDKAANDRAQGVAEERARVMAWLRSIGVFVVAAEIKRGEHEEVK